MICNARTPLEAHTAGTGVGKIIPVLPLMLSQVLQGVGLKGAAKSSTSMSLLLLFAVTCAEVACQVGFIRETLLALSTHIQQDVHV